MTAAFLFAFALASQSDVALFSRPNPDLEAGIKALQEEDYDGAIDHYRRAKAKDAKERAVVEYNVGIAALEKAQHLQMMEAVKKAQSAAGIESDETLDENVAATPDFDAATDALERAYKLADTSTLRSQAALGVGNAHALREDFKKAVDGYRRALVQDPTNAAARNNLRTTLRRMRLAKPPPNQGESGDDQENGEGDEGDESEDGKEGSSSEKGDSKKDDAGDKSQDGESADKKGEDNAKSDADDASQSDPKDGEEADSADGDQGQDGASEKERADEKNGDKSNDDKKNDSKSSAGDEKSGDAKDQKNDDGDRKPSDKSASDQKEDQQKPGDDDKENGAKNSKDGAKEDEPTKSEAQDVNDKNEKGPQDDPSASKNPSPPKASQGPDGQGGGARAPESAEKRRARALLDAMRRRERPLGSVMMNAQSTPRRKSEKDW